MVLAFLHVADFLTTFRRRRLASPTSTVEIEATHPHVKCRTGACRLAQPHHATGGRDTPGRGSYRRARPTMVRATPWRSRWSFPSVPLNTSSYTPARRSGGGRRADAVRRRVPGSRARSRAGRRDPLARRTGSSLQGDGGVRRPHPLHLQVRGRRPPAGQRGAGARPGVPGVRYPDGAGGRRHRHRPRARGHLHLLRRHDARAGSRGQPVGCQGRGRRRADGLLAARRAAHRPREPGPRGGVLRDRLRDDRAVDREPHRQRHQR